MTSGPALQDTQFTPGRVMTALRDHGWSWKSCGAGAGLIGGVFAPLLGLALTMLAWFVAAWHGIPLKNTGAILLLLTIPLLIFGAHCLDLIDNDDQRAKSVVLTDQPVSLKKEK